MARSGGEAKAGRGRRRRLVPLGLLLVMVLAAAAPAAAEHAARSRLPGIKGMDDRKPVESLAWPWSAIGRVNRRTGGFCTGALVAPDRVLTAAHCLWNKRTGRWLPARALRFVAGYRRGTSLATAPVAGYAIPGGYRPGRGGRGQEVADWAVLRLARELGSVVGVIAVAPLDRDRLARWRRRGALLVQAGYSEDKAQILSRDAGCAIVGFTVAARLVLHDCDATRGDSGSPLMMRRGTEWRLVAMHVATIERRGRIYGLAVAGTVFWRWLARARAERGRGR